ncbi:polyprenyl synthetase family protein [Pedobacter sp. SYP-B3415]|uniref:polyprenyl synthetase family protein n=1 Tax=Pedobacter sp. SYP-B3415 TaxID=2496641 RepID=UPI00101E04B3|nr:polyprenyl synthetase family protein [Pedobacter sp. SYP-B3415]
MQGIERIKQPIAEDIKAFEKNFKASMHSDAPLLDRITHYIVKQKGKQVRPMFVFFAAKLCGGINESTHRGASLVELLHTATLVHDDVVDNAYERRGFFSINALWKNKIAVLVGDYLLAKGLLLSVNNNEHRLLKIVSEAVKQMSEGELLQIEKVRRMDISETLYFDVIRQKTASLIASCCACGAASAGADDDTIEKMRYFGELVGIAFQIKDDTFDFGTDDVGKPLGIDIKEKKVTLPLIYALNRADRAEKKRMINLVKNHRDEPAKIREIIDFVNKMEGVKYANEKMQDYQEQAFQILAMFPPGEARTGLEELVRYTTERKK